MDKEYLKKHNLLESVERFQKIFEYVDASGSYKVNEDGPDDAQPDPNAAPADPSMGGMPQDPSMGGMPGPDMGADPNAMPQDPNMGGAPAPEEAPAAAPEGFAPQDPSMGADPNMGADPMAMPEGEEDEEVIDVDDLTDAQEETEDKLDKLTSKFETLINKIEDFEHQIDSSNEKMESIRAEIEKRNPTPVEKLSLRSGKGYPFNQTPDDYWKEKEATSNYSTEDDENGKNDKVYQITKDEIDNFNDYANISKTFDDYDIRNMFGY